MTVVVSACLLGQRCKYNGGSNLSEAVRDYVRSCRVIPVCPELLGGLGCPRLRAELAGGTVLNERGEDVGALFRLGVERALLRLEGEQIDLAILQSRSPTCGVRSVYDGTFSGRLIPGRGLFAQALAERGVPLADAEDFLPKK